MAAVTHTAKFGPEVYRMSLARTACVLQHKSCTLSKLTLSNNKSVPPLLRCPSVRKTRMRSTLVTKELLTCLLNVHAAKRKGRVHTCACIGG